MASCRGSNLSETLRCPDIAHNRLNLRLPITAQILSSSKVHRGHPGILLLTASSSTICICQSLKILEKLNYEYFTLLQYAKSGWKYPFAKTTRGESCQPVVKYLPKITTLELFSALVSMPAGSHCFRKMTCNGCKSVPVFFFSFFVCFSFLYFGPSLCME